MVPLKNSRYLRALLRQPVDRRPVWFMRQAGRYLPEYRALRAQAGDFMSLCRDPDLACEAALQPLRRFALDAAIIFSDILTIPDAMGLGLHFTAGVGPHFKRPLLALSEIRQLAIPDPEADLGYVMETVRRLRHALQGSVPVIGFSGSPWTLAAYMVEGRASRTFERIQRLLLEEPATLHLLLDKLADSVILYLNAQITAGAQSVMIFDSWGGLLSDQTYRRFSLDYLHKIVASVIREQDQQRIPITLFTRGGGAWLEVQAEIGCDALGLDEWTPIADARRRVGDRVALQGNLSPALLYTSREELQQAVVQLLDDYGGGPGHIINLGHGIPPDVLPEQLQAIVEVLQRQPVGLPVSL
jgi:uroporphyrinogen decarboxylase